MNVLDLPPGIPGIFEQTCRRAFVDPVLKARVLKETGWDPSMLSKILQGAGVTFDKIDGVCRATALTIVEIDYMEYLTKGNIRGANCRCARMALGQCGPGAMPMGFLERG
jgi:hypothetical protein